jgi:hypothetical protein
MDKLIEIGTQHFVVYIVKNESCSRGEIESCSRGKCSREKYSRQKSNFVIELQRKQMRNL